jgi:hypothetical protein
MVLSPPNTRGKGDAVEDIIKFLSVHQHDLLRGKSTTSETLNKWITECKKLADAEQARRDEIEAKGRGAQEIESIPRHITIWCDLMSDYEENYGKKSANATKATSTSRYAIPDHIRALGIELQKSDSSFLPRHSTKEQTRIGQKDREEAISRIREIKKRVASEPLESISTYGSIDTRGGKPYLRPNSLQKEGNDSRDKLLSVMVNFFDAETRNTAAAAAAAAAAASAQLRKEKSQELKGYVDSLAANPDLASTYTPLIKAVSQEILLMSAQEISKNHCDQVARALTGSVQQNTSGDNTPPSKVSPQLEGSQPASGHSSPSPSS